MPTPETARHQLDLSPHERREVEAEIGRLRQASPVPVIMAPGYYSDSPLFPCAPLTLQEYNLDYRGNLTLCCQLSGVAGVNAGTELMGNLHELSLAEACTRFHQRVATYVADKQEQVRRGAFSMLDHFPCWYCMKYMNKVAWLSLFPQHPWAEGDGETVGERNHGDVGSTGTPPP